MGLRLGGKSNTDIRDFTEDKNLKNTLWRANPHSSGFDGGGLCRAYVSELTTPATVPRRQCRPGTLPSAGR